VNFRGFRCFSEFSGLIISGFGIFIVSVSSVSQSFCEYRGFSGFGGLSCYDGVSVNFTVSVVSSFKWFRWSYPFSEFHGFSCICGLSGFTV